MTIHSFSGKRPQIGDRVFISPTGYVLGDVVLDADCSVWPGAVIRGDMQRIRIGQRTSVQDGAVLHITHASAYHPDGFPLTIGTDVTIGHQACLHGCHIGNEVLIGIGAVVLDGARIEDRVILAAGALVPPGKVLASGFLYKGSPAQPARALSEAELNYFKYTAGNYVKLKDKYLSEGLGE